MPTKGYEWDGIPVTLGTDDDKALPKGTRSRGRSRGKPMTEPWVMNSAQMNALVEAFREMHKRLEVQE